MNPQLKAYFARIGAKGGRKSRRVLTSAQAKAMVAQRDKNRKQISKQKQ